MDAAVSHSMPSRPETLQGLHKSLRLGTSLENMIRDYFCQTSTDAYVETIYNLADEATERSTPAFREAESPEILTANFIAAHEEEHYIGAALEQYVGPAMEGAPPQRTILFCNWPKGANLQRVNATLNIIQAFQEAHPEASLGLCTRQLGERTAIGTVVKMAVDTTLYSVRSTLRDQHDILLELNSADIVPGYYAAMHRTFRMPGVQPRLAFVPRVRREQTDGRFPNLDSVIAWSDLLLEYGECYLEAGLALSARGYMMINGCDPVRRKGEAHNMVTRMTVEETKTVYHKVEEAELIISARREWAHLRAGGSPHMYWAGGFGMNESYRLNAGAEDITSDERDRMVHELLYEGFNSIAVVMLAGQLARGASTEAAWAYTSLLLRRATERLGGNVKQPDKGGMRKIIAKAIQRSGIQKIA